MVEITARAALESMMHATDDGSTPIIRRLARIQARAVLDASSEATPAMIEAADALAALPTVTPSHSEGRFKIGDRVEKTKGASWRGIVVGTYSTSLTAEGYAVESENEPGSVQIYPVAALSAPVASEGRE